MSVFDRAQAAQIVAREMQVVMAYAQAIEPFVINKYTFTHEQIVHMLIVDLAQLDVHMAQVAGWIGYWGVLTAAAKKAHDRYQARYRAGRDTFISTAAQDVDDSGDAAVKKPKKKSKTAAEAEWRTLPDYEKLYAEAADLEYAWSCAQFIYEALNRKANMLTALGKLYADERSAPQSAGIPANASR